MIEINLEDNRLLYPGFYNINPIQKEFSTSIRINDLAGHHDHMLLDDCYGRILNPKFKNHYGRTEDLHYYKKFDGYKIVDELRVPFRRIPVYEYKSIEQIELFIKTVKSENPGHEILIRGQEKLYTIKRSEEENDFLYGDPVSREPSFLPSFLRSDFKEFFIYNLWHSQTALMLNDVGVDLKNRLSSSDLESYYQDVAKIKHSPHFTPIALGFAQHYGFPSIGLDLTQDINVAAWFATNNLEIDKNSGTAFTRPIEQYEGSTIFIFRCPRDAVFSYKVIKPKYITDTRPDRQDAWFGHVGWGNAKNELASFLVCGIRLNEDIQNIFAPDYERSLFPCREEDLILNFFLDVKDNAKYRGEVKRALSRIYALE